MPPPLMTRAGLGPSWLGRHHTRLWDTLRMTAAAAVTFVLGVTLGLSQSFWAVIAAVVATQSSLGGTLKASFEQFIGSVFGAVWGGAITIAIPHQTPCILCLTLVVAVAPLGLADHLLTGISHRPDHGHSGAAQLHGGHHGTGRLCRRAPAGDWLRVRRG